MSLPRDGGAHERGDPAKPIKIIDAHVHIPSADGDNLGWPTAKTVGEVLRKLDEAGIGQAVITSVRSAKAKDMGECRAGNREMLKAVEEHSTRFIGACQVHPSSVGEAVEELTVMRERYGIRWLGELCGYLGGYGYDTADFAEILRAASELGMVIQIHTTDIPVLERHADAFPATPFVLSHMGSSADYPRRLAAVRSRANLYIDISGSDISRCGILEAYIHEAGADKVLFATDYVVCEPIVYVARLQSLGLSRPEQEAIFHGNIERLLNRRSGSAPDAP